MDHLESQNERLKAKYLNWDSILVLHESVKNELSEFELAKLKPSITFLRREFGEEFPGNCLDSNHPMKHYFLNRAPHTRCWFIWLADALESARRAENAVEL